MRVNYKKELEVAAKRMILIRETNTLIKLILRMIVQKVKVRHAGILLRHKDGKHYVLTASRGPSGLKIPAGFARMDNDNPLIRFFQDEKYKRHFKTPIFVCEEAKKMLRKNLRLDIEQLFRGAMEQMDIFEAVICVPCYFRDDLLGLLLLGKKKHLLGFGNDELDFFTALASDVAMAIRNSQLFRDLELELDSKQRLFINTTIALAAAIDAKDHYTHGHTTRVTYLSLEIAKKISSKISVPLNADFFEHLQIAGLLHDIGKIGIPESILNKNGPLDANEWKKMKEHPNVGAVILQHIGELKNAILGVKYHHENYDGSGYPEGLKGDQIPLIASIIAVADTFDAMTTDRPYRHGLSKQEAIEEIKKVSGKQLNPDVVLTFIELQEETPHIFLKDADLTH